MKSKIRPITTFQHGFSDHLGSSFLIKSGGVYQYHYISFEDAIWDLLNTKLKRGDTILVPSFFCVDVVNNINFHGYNYEFYEVTPDFKIKFSQFKLAFEKVNPACVFIFHTFGMKNEVLSNDQFWDLTKGKIIIEDCVHRILNNQDLVFKNENHFFIDSTRKLTPFFGSTLYSKTLLNLTYSKNDKDAQNYSKKTYEFWLKFQILNRLGNILMEQKYLNKAYDFLNSGDNLIGDSKYSVKLSKWRIFLKYRIDKEKLEIVRFEQCAIYIKELKNELKNYNFCLPNSYLFESENWCDLAFFPIALKSDYAFLLREFLLKNGVCTFVEFSDCPWAINKNVVCLPLGIHIDNSDVWRVCTLVKDWFRSNYILN